MATESLGKVMESDAEYSLFRFAKLENMTNDFEKEENQRFVVHRKWKWNKSLIQ